MFKWSYSSAPSRHHRSKRQVKCLNTCVKLLYISVLPFPFFFSTDLPGNKLLPPAQRCQQNKNNSLPCKIGDYSCPIIYSWNCKEGFSVNWLFRGNLSDRKFSNWQVSNGISRLVGELKQILHGILGFHLYHSKSLKWMGIKWKAP